MDQQTRKSLHKQVSEIVSARRSSLTDDVRFVSSSDYVDPARQKTEREVLFRRHTLAVTLSCRISNPHDFVTENVAGLPLLIVRGNDGIARAFINSCRHRGFTVVTEPSGNRRRFTCGYHAWTYGDKGECVSFVDKEAFEGLDLQDFGLIELPSEERHGFVWVVPTPGANIDVADYLGKDLDKELSNYGLDKQTVFKEDTLRRDFNWKLAMDSFQEVFHVNILHRNSLTGLFNGLSALSGYGRHHRFTPIRATFNEAAAQPDKAQEILPHTSVVYVLFPNTLIIWQLDHIELWHMYPAEDSDDQCEMRVFLLVPEPPDERAIRYWTRNWEVLQGAVWKEDFDAMTLVQRNMKSGGARNMVFGRNEGALKYYHDRLDEAIQSPMNAVDH